MSAISTRQKPFPATAVTGVRPRRNQVRPFGGRRSCRAAIHAPRTKAVLFISVELDGQIRVIRRTTDVPVRNVKAHKPHRASHVVWAHRQPEAGTRTSTSTGIGESALEHAVREEEIPRNVARNVRTGTPRPRRFEPLTADEARRLLTTAQGHRLDALFELVLHTGLRKGELLGLRWEDVDLDTGTAAIRRTLQRISAGGLTMLPTKTRASERRIALATRCAQSLKLHRERQQREREAAGTTWQHSGHVFTTPRGGTIDPTNLTRTFTTLLRKAGLRRIRFHDLRHSTATLLLEQGVELVVIKELLGHAHTGVTATVYAHVRLRLQRDAIDTLSTALDGPVSDESTRDDGDDPPLCGAIVP